MGGGWSAPRPGRFTPRKDPISIVQEAGWAPGPVWTGAENLTPTGIRSPDLPAGSESLYRLSYRGRCTVTKRKQNWIIVPESALTTKNNIDNSGHVYCNMPLSETISRYQNEHCLHNGNYCNTGIYHTVSDSREKCSVSTLNDINCVSLRNVGLLFVTQKLYTDRHLNQGSCGELGTNQNKLIVNGDYSEICINI